MSALQTFVVTASEELIFFIFLFQMYAILKRTDVPSKLGDLEVMILLVSCICHDLDHPGYNNIYQINARTELALRLVILTFLFNLIKLMFYRYFKDTMIYHR